MLVSFSESWLTTYFDKIVWIFNCHPELSWYCSHLELIMHCNGGFCMQFKLQVIPFQSSLLPARVFTWSSSEIDWNNPGGGSRQRLHNWTQSKLQFDPGCLKYFFQTHAFYVFTVIQVDHHKPPPSLEHWCKYFKRLTKILTKLCFLFKWVILDLGLSLSSPLHPLLAARCPQTAFYAISISAKENSLPETSTPHENH